MKRSALNIVNAITLYRLFSAPVLIVLVFTGQLQIFRWLLPLSFVTDLVDGPIARKLKVTTILGAKLDSIADDLTVLAGIIGLLVFKPAFVKEELVLIAILLFLFVLQLVRAFLRYGRMTSFHTYAAKAAAILQGLFLIFTFFFDEPLYLLFYTAWLATLVDVVEEIILVMLLRTWQSNVKGAYWILREKHVAAPDNNQSSYQCKS
jgi:CDP-diacylglycerol--glycerol-3-phosphate 3-phosphatidyltransferase